MIELIRTTDPVLCSYVRALLTSVHIEPIELDFHMSVLEGSQSAIPRRIMVEAGDIDAARRLLRDADIEPSADD